MPCGPDGRDWTYSVVKTPTLSSIFKLHGKHRLATYVDRKAFQLATWDAELRKLAAQWRFVNAVMDGTLDIRRKATAVIEAMLVDAGYPTDTGVAPPLPPSDRDLQQAAAGAAKEKVDDQDESKDESEAGRFRYLTSMPMSSFSKERLAKLESKTRSVEAKVASLRDKDPWDMWAEELASARPKIVAFMEEKRVRALAMPSESVTTRRKPSKAKQRRSRPSKSKAKAPSKTDADVAAFFK